MANESIDLKGTTGSAEATVKRALLAVKTLQAKVQELERARSEPIAVVGIGCRFPGASGPDEFWRLLADGVDAVGEIPVERWDSAAFFDPDPDAPGKMSSKWGAFLARVDEFDAEFFGISPREAAALDPQQRLFLEVAWEAIEHAGQAPDKLLGERAGVFLGISTLDYLHVQNVGGLSHISAFTGTGNAFSTAAGRVSYTLGLQGPSIAVDTACSSSLVCVHLACNSLKSRESDIALAGGVNLMLSPATSIAVSKYHALSPDGRCKAFDAAANGFVRGEGCGVVVLKRLSDALANRDQVLGLIRGSAINQDGRSSGLTAPNVLAQQAVLLEALSRAGVAAREVSYVEAHGTGTTLGDPIEVTALTEVYGATDAPACALASVKTNLGHLEAAAGVAGLIKVLLALEHESIPPHLHFRQLNPSITLAGTGFYVPTQSVRWPRQDRSRLAAVSSFGISGTNAHAVVEEGPVAAAPASVPDRAAHVFTLSARSEAALRELSRRYERHLAERDVALGDVCFTANSGRARFGHRLALVARSVEHLREQLARVHLEYAPSTALSASVVRNAEPRIGFLFSGQGAQSAGMGHELYRTEPAFRYGIERCDALARSRLGASLLDVLYPPAGKDSAIDSARFAAVATFAVQHALVELWRSWGIAPNVVAGHSVGEYAAAWAAGVMSLEDALALVVERSRLMAGVQASGGMAVVHAAAEQVEAVLSNHPDVVIAALNGPRNVVVSGASEPLRSALLKLQRTGFQTNVLKTAQAFHSPLLDGILDPFESVVKGVALRSPSVAYVSSVTGKLAEGELVEARYWRRHLREPVRFAEAVRTLQSERCDAFIEIGPAPVLLALAEPELRKGDAEAAVRPRRGPVCVASLAKTRPDPEQLARSVGQLFLAGIDVDWAGLDGGRSRRRVALPTYAFERKRHWFDGRAHLASAMAEPDVNALLGRPIPLASEQRVFESEFSAAALPFLADHRVYDRIVVPAAAHVAIALMACGEVLETACPVVERMVFEEPLVLEPAARVRVQVVLDPDGPGRYRFCVASLDPDRGRSFRQHAVGQLTSDSSAPCAPVDLGVLRVRLQEAYSAPRFYEELRAVGIDLGAQFQGIVGLSRAEGEVLGRLQLPDGVLALGPKYLHPVLIDSCLQLLGAILASTTEEREIYLPMSIERVALRGVAQGALSGHAALNARQSREVLEGSVTLHTEDGATILSASGVLAHLAPRELFFRTSAVGAAQYELTWQKNPRKSGSNSGVYGSAGRWLIFSEQGELSRCLATRLAAHGHSCVVVTRGKSLELEPLRATIDPTHRAHYRALLEAATSDGVRLAGIVHLWGLEAPLAAETPEEPLSAQRLTCESLLLLLQASSERGSAAKPPPAVTLVTRDAAAIGGSPSHEGLAHAAVWGLRRAAALEYPGIDCAIVDLGVELDIEATARALEQELTARDGEREIAYRGGARFTPRISARPPAHGAREHTFSAAGTYLVTGGMGALGLEVARWLVRNGARALVLVGRSVPSPAALEAIQALRGDGARVTLVSADVSEASGVALALAALTPELPLRGVFHAAGVLDDAVLDNQSWERFERVFAPKVAGAWHLHAATRALELDCFVLFSSLASVLGSAGQANYAAANAFLDALAHHRRGLGMPALSVNFGPWALAGMAAGNESEQRRRERRGVMPLEPEQALAELGRLIASGVPQAAIANVDWPRLAATAAGAFSGSLLSEVLPRSATRAIAPSAAGPSELLDRIRAAVPEGRRSVLAKHVQAEVAAVLGLDGLSPAQIPVSFAELGMNSLMAVELRNRLEANTGCRLPTVAIFNYPTADALTDYLGQALGLSADDSSPPAPAHDAASSAASRIAGLSEAEVEALLLKTIEQIQ